MLICLIFVLSTQLFLKEKIMCRIILKQSVDLFPVFPEKGKQTIFERTLSSGLLSFKSNSSQRSKYLSTSKLTRAKLFSTIDGKRTAEKNEKHQELNTQIGVLEDLVTINKEKEDEISYKLKKQMRVYKNDCRKILRALQHWQP